MKYWEMFFLYISNSCSIQCPSCLQGSANKSLLLTLSSIKKLKFCTRHTEHATPRIIPSLGFYVWSHIKHTKNMPLQGVKCIFLNSFHTQFGLLKKVGAYFLILFTAANQRKPIFWAKQCPLAC
ncbi:hypothetical protein O6H91_22G037300 [Diphasiastrum complanatum]|uniref:Uncharacterized protein n=1 Tax=Diphasiastrum complanatum TaxID=34168 RepID=A0ACC2AEI8_DIPCM|nr:hypothetical protein O6H91_22G037300 [Diphasiastrum complanatum]